MQRSNTSSNLFERMSVDRLGAREPEAEAAFGYFRSIPLVANGNLVPRGR